MNEEKYLRRFHRKHDANHPRQLNCHASYGNNKRFSQQNIIFVTPFHHHRDDDDGADHADVVDVAVVLVVDHHRRHQYLEFSWDEVGAKMTPLSKPPPNSEKRHHNGPQNVSHTGQNLCDSDGTSFLSSAIKITAPATLAILAFVLTVGIGKT